uniref:Nuclease HARBI1 n=1 Tax=Romanomermis culicivorax TaxID=13658 RepID=A0A915KYQ3_ROMCU
MCFLGTVITQFDKFASFGVVWRTRIDFTNPNWRQVLEITDLVKCHLEHSTNQSKALPANLQALIALRYLASNSFLQVVGHTVCCSKSTASRIVNKFCFSLCQRLNQFVQYPTGLELNDHQHKFCDMAGFPQVSGNIDKTLDKFLHHQHIHKVLCAKKDIMQSMFKLFAGEVTK